MVSFRRARVDRWVAALEVRLKPFQAPVPKDSAGKRRHMADVDRATSIALGVVPIAAATEEHVLPVPGAPDARLRVYWPSEQRAEPGAGLPILVHFFGGGFEIGGIDWISWDASFRERARDAGVIVVAGEYSLAPDFTFPAQPEQCWTVFEWAAQHAEALGGDADRMAVGGGSSGANLAVATALMNRDRAARPVRLQLLEVPVLDLTGNHIDARGIAAPAAGLLLKPLLRRLVRQYVGARGDRRSPYASPLLAPSLTGMPPTVIYTSEMDPLRGDGEAYARALSEAGVPVTCLRVIGQTHVSTSTRHRIPAADHVHRDVITTLRTLHGEPERYPSLDPGRGA